jgi:hypothetical protein
MPDAVGGLVTLLAEGDERLQPMRGGPLPVMRVQAIPRATSLTGEAIPHFRPQHPFMDVERRPVASATTRYTDSDHIEMPGWADLAHRIVPVRQRAVSQVWVRKPPDTFVPVAGTDEFGPRRKPLMHGEGVSPFLQHGRPARSAMDHPGLLSDEGLGAAAFVLLEQPAEIAMPGVAADRLKVTEEAGVLVVPDPPSDDGVETVQAGHLIEPGPAALCEGLDGCLDARGVLGCRPKMDHPASARATASDVESEEVEPVVDVSDHGLVGRQREVKVGREEGRNLLHGLLDPGVGVIADDHEIVRKTDHRVMAPAGVAGPLTGAPVDGPPRLGPPIKLMEVDIGQEGADDPALRDAGVGGA